MKKNFVRVVTVCASFFALSVLYSFEASAGLKHLPVQDGGRVKPFDTFAREILQLTWGRETYKGQQGKKVPATEVVLSWMMIPEEWDKAEFILIRHNGLREALNLPTERLYYSPNEILTNERLALHMQELKNRRDAREKLDPFYQSLQTLENQVGSYHAVRIGMGLRLIPDTESSTWLHVGQLTGEAKDQFAEIGKKYVDIAKAELSNDKDAARVARAELDTVADQFVNTVDQAHPGYAPFDRINAEVHYNNLHPFRWAWVLYLVAMVFWGVVYFGGRDLYTKVAWTALVGGAAFHIWGLAIRIYILERPPVSNMYETVNWVALVALLFSAILYRFSANKILMFAASMVATFCLILCDVSSSVLDDTLTPLEPVLRDTFWLMTHVIIIVSSYAAFFLAFVLGDIVLFYFLRDEKKYEKQIAQGVLAIYRVMQIGVVLLAAGTILGGVWADYSWGRFWGWDPKETWAFIALMGYIIILHGRIAGWLRGFGLAAASVLAFSLVIMAWYGVNFVLGAGLHTYGFGAGGVEYVSAFVAAHILYVAYVVTLRQSRMKAAAK